MENWDVPRMIFIHYSDTPTLHFLLVFGFAA